MNLVLIGYRGTGKSAVAEVLSRRLAMAAVSFDEEVVRAAGMPIPEIVEKHGWSWFRDLESEVVRSFAQRDDVILDSGGGVVLRPENTESLRRNGVLFWLRASVDVIVERIQDSGERPALSDGKSFLEEVEEVLAERLPLYRAAADREIDTDALTVNEVADEIVREFRALASAGSIEHGLIERIASSGSALERSTEAPRQTAVPGDLSGTDEGRITGRARGEGRRGVSDSTRARTLRRRATLLRRHLLTMASNGQVIHLGGSASIADLMAALYFDFLEVEGRGRPKDRFILSKGHAVHAFHACLAELGEIEASEFSTLGRIGTRLAGHPSKRAPLVEFATGSLGHGLSLGIGVALADRLDGLTSRTVVLMGDGELQEGSVWEAALCAPHFGLANLMAIVDRNGFQASAAVDDVLPLDPLEGKWRSFGWSARVIDGHDMEAILEALDRFPAEGGPTVIIADTVKGKGVPAVEGRARAHFTSLTDDEVREALEGLGME